MLRAMNVGARANQKKTLLDKELLHTIRAVHAGKKTLSAEASYELAEHSTDDALMPGEVEVLRVIAPGKCQQTDCGAALDYRRNRQRTSQEHPIQVGRK